MNLKSIKIRMLLIAALNLTGPLVLDAGFESQFPIETLDDIASVPQAPVEDQIPELRNPLVPFPNVPIDNKALFVAVNSAPSKPPVSKSSVSKPFLFIFSGQSPPQI